MTPGIHATAVLIALVFCVLLGVGVVVEGRRGR